MIDRNKFEKFINLPWKENGFDYDGVDCAGLVYLFYKDYLTPLHSVLPQYVFDAEEKHLKTVIDFLSLEGFKTNPIPEFGDIVLFGGTKLTGAHVGVYTTQNNVLHIWENKNSCVEPIYRIGRVLEYYTLRKR